MFYFPWLKISNGIPLHKCTDKAPNFFRNSIPIFPSQIVEPFPLEANGGIQQQQQQQQQQEWQQLGYVDEEIGCVDGLFFPRAISTIRDENEDENEEEDERIERPRSESTTGSESFGHFGKANCLISPMEGEEDGTHNQQLMEEKQHHPTLDNSPAKVGENYEKNLEGKTHFSSAILQSHFTIFF
jgi:hypothetical protein